MGWRNKDIHQHIPFLFLAKYEACNPIRNYKLKLLKKQIFQMFKTTQNQQQAQDIVCKIKDHTFVQLYKTNLFTVLKFQII